MRLQQTIDGIAFLKEQVEKIGSSVDFCYPNSHLDEDRCHGQLQAIQASVKAMRSFLNNIKETGGKKVKDDKKKTEVAN